MTNSDIQKMIESFVKDGGEITKCKPSKTRFKTWRGKSGAWNKGAKKIGLQDRNHKS
jgi:hypothetical protein